MRTPFWWSLADWLTGKTTLVLGDLCRMSPPIDKQHSANCQLNLIYNDSIFYPEFFRSLLLNDPRAATAHTEPDSVDFRACILFISVTSVTLPVFGTSVVYSFWINDLLYCISNRKIKAAGHFVLEPPECIDTTPVGPQLHNAIPFNSRKSSRT